MTAGPVRELFRQDIFISHMQRIKVNLFNNHGVQDLCGQHP